MKGRVDALHEMAINGVRLEVRKAYLDLDAARKQVEVARASVAQAQESLRIGQNRYGAGLSTITDLLRMQEAALRAQTDYLQSLYRLQTGYANLELATGTLDANSPVVKQ
jgi:outer membrane protein TolC